MDLRDLGLVGALRKACLAASAAGIKVTLSAERYVSQDRDRELAMLRVGQRVKVQLGRNNKPSLGYVVSIRRESDFPRIKKLEEI